MRKIVTYPHPILRLYCQPVKTWSKEIEETSADLAAALIESKIGIGLAAPQVGESLRFFAIRESVLSETSDHDEGRCRIVVNPRFEPLAGKEKIYPATVDQHGHKEEFLEGCLSFPDIFAPVKRWLKIKALWQEPSAKGKLVKQERVLSGLAAIVFQHELDHLDGILFIDLVKKEGRKPFRINEKGKKVPVDVPDEC